MHTKGRLTQISIETTNRLKEKQQNSGNKIEVVDHTPSIIR